MNWDEEREAFGDTVIDTIAEYAPNIKDIILHKQVVTPLDLERDFGLTEGNIFQGELSLEQLVLPASRAGIRAVPHADQEPLYVRIGHASRRRNHGRARTTGGAGNLERREPASADGRDTRRRHHRRWPQRAGHGVLSGQGRIQAAGAGTPPADRRRRDHGRIFIPDFAAPRWHTHAGPLLAGDRPRHAA